MKENCITVTKEYPLHEKLVMLREQQEYSRAYAAERLDLPEEDFLLMKEAIKCQMSAPRLIPVHDERSDDDEYEYFR